MCLILMSALHCDIQILIKEIKMPLKPGILRKRQWTKTECTYCTVHPLLYYYPFCTIELFAENFRPYRYDKIKSSRSTNERTCF